MERRDRARDFDPLGEFNGNKFEYVESPAVAAGPDGRLTAVWSAGNRDLRQQVIRTSTLDNGAWSAAETISGDFRPYDPNRRVFEHRFASQVAFDSAGRTLVLWTHSFEDVDDRTDWEKNMVYFETSTRAAGATAFAPGEEIARRTATEQPTRVQMGMAEDGVATFSWGSFPTTGDGTTGESVRARRRAASGALGAITPLVSPDGTYNHLDPKIAVTPGGDATMVWTRSERFPTASVPDDVLARTWNADGTWAQPQPEVVGAGLSTEAVDVAAGRDKTVAVAWQRYRGDRSQLRGFVRLRRPDGAWADAVTLTPEGQGSQDPFVAVEGDGDALAIWRSRSFNDATFTQTDFVETMATGTPPPPPPPPAPQVVIDTPSLSLQTFQQGQRVTASYSCTNHTSCVGPVASGALLDTSTIGRKAFEVVARNAAGNEERRTHFYDVVARSAGPPPPSPTPDQSPPSSRTPDQPTPTRIALERLSVPVVDAVKAAPSKVKASTLLKGKLDLSVKPLTPNVDVRGGLTLIPPGLGLISDNGLGLISDNGLGIIGRASSNIVSRDGAGIITQNGGNIVSRDGAGLINRSGGALTGSAAGNTTRSRARSAAKLKVLARGAKYFGAPAAGNLRLKVGKKGRASLRRAFRKPGRQTIKIIYMVGFTERGSGLPTVFTARVIKLRE